MKTKDWLDQYNYSPLDIEEIAYTTPDDLDNELLVEAANDFLIAKQRLQHILYDIGFEFG